MVIFRPETALDAVKLRKANLDSVYLAGGSVKCCSGNNSFNFNSSFSSSTPATSSNVTLFLSVGFNTLALLFPNVIVLFPF